MNVAAGANIAAVCDSALASRRTRTQTATAVCQSRAGFKTAHSADRELSSVAGGKQYETDVAIVLFFNDTTTTEIYTLALRDALPI